MPRRSIRARDAVEGLLISALSDRLTVGAVLKLSCVQCAVCTKTRRSNLSTRLSRTTCGPRSQCAQS